MAKNYMSAFVLVFSTFLYSFQLGSFPRIKDIKDPIKLKTNDTVKAILKPEINSETAIPFEPICEPTKSD